MLKTEVFVWLTVNYTHRSDIAFCESIFLKNERIVVPTTPEGKLKSLIHQGYLGIENCKKALGNHYFGY